MSLADLKAQFEHRKAAYHQQVGQRDQLRLQRDELQAETSEIDARTVVNQRQVVLLQKTSENARKRKKAQIEQLVTRAVQIIFGPEYGFEIDMDVRGAKPEIDIYVTTITADGLMRNKPQDARGGGVQDIISFVLRVAYIVLHNEPSVARVLLIDEVLKMVSVDHGPAVAEFINWVCEQFDLQILFVTHNEDYASSAKRSFQVSISEGVSDLLEVEGGTLLM